MAFHMDINNKVAKCEAKKPSACPRFKEGKPHFNTMTEALSYENKLLVDKYGPLGAAMGRRSERNNALLKDAFSKLEHTVAYDETTDANGRRILVGNGSEVEYTIREVPNGRSFVYYKRGGVDIRPSSWHEDISEAQKAVETFENNW